MNSHFVFLLLAFLPLIIAGSEEEFENNVHGDYGSRITKIEGNKEELLISAESSRVERQIPLSAGLGHSAVGVGVVSVPVVATSVPVVEQHIHHHHIDHVVTHEEEVPEIDVWDIRDSVPGTPNEDYPVLRSIPKTRFTCNDRIPGYYADADTKCQVFHRCSDNEESARKKMDSFLCLKGTTFNQEILSCDWWENVRCDNASKFYGLNKELNMRGEDGKYIQLSAKREASGLKKPLSPGIIPKEERVPLPPQFRSPLNRIQATEAPPGSDDDIEEVDEVELEDPPEISEVQVETVTSTTEHPGETGQEEDEDIAYFFTPEQIKNIRASQDFGEKLKEGATQPTQSSPTTSKTTTKISKSIRMSVSKSKSIDPPKVQFRSAETTPIPSESTSRIPIYRSARVKTQTDRLFQTTRKEKGEAEDLFERKLKEGGKRRSPEVNDLPSESSFRKPIQPKRKLRKVKRLKLRKTKENSKEKTASLPLGFPYPAEQIIVAPNGTAKKLKYKHLLHSDVTESFPPYVSGGRLPVQPIYPFQPPYSAQYPYQAGQILAPYPAGQISAPYPAGQILAPHPAGQILTPYHYGSPGLSYPQAYGFPSANSIVDPFQIHGSFPPTRPTVTHEHHHHHTAGTHHRALEPHHVFPTHERNQRAPQKFLAPHDVIPALYHPHIVGAPGYKNPEVSQKRPDGMHLVDPHHALSAHPVAVNLGDRLAHHHHQVYPIIH